YELLDTGVFNNDRYFDVFVEYAKKTSEDILIQISVCNRGPDTATIDVLPTLWFRNTWAWWPGTPKPGLKQIQGPEGVRTVIASPNLLGDRFFYCEKDVPRCLPRTKRITSASSAHPAPVGMSRTGSTTASWPESWMLSILSYWGRKLPHTITSWWRRENSHHLAAAERSA